MNKFVLFHKLSEETLNVTTYNTLKELHEANPGIIKENGCWEPEIGPTHCVSFVHDQYGALCLEEVLDFDELFEEEEPDTADLDDGWVEVEVNGLKMKVPAGTTQEDIKSALTCCCSYDSPEVSL